MWELYGIVGMLTSKKLGQHESSETLASMAAELTDGVSIVFTMMVSYPRQINHGEPFGPRNHSLHGPQVRQLLQSGRLSTSLVIVVSLVISCTTGL
jgi:hypothetical protein